MIRYLLVACLFLFAGCSQNEHSRDSLQTWMADNGKIKVLSTTAMIDDLVGQIGGVRIDHLALITGDIDPHSYELVKGDDEKLTFAHVIFSNGLGLEHGASLRYQLEQRKAIALGDRVREKTPEAIIVRGGALDPHIWMDIPLWMEIVDPIVEELSKIDPAGAAEYRANGSALKKEMTIAHDELVEKFSDISREKKYLVTSHDAFNYFARRYLGREESRCAAPEGLAPDGQLSSSDIQKIIDHLALHQIQVVFPESNVSKDSLRKIVSACREKGLKVKIADKTLYADALGVMGSDADTYLKMMQYNVSVLLKEWNEFIRD